MKTELRQTLKIPSTQVDQNCLAGLLPSLSILQDNMCEYFQLLGADGFTMVPVCNCFFVITKTKLKFIRQPKWLENVSLVTDMCKLSNIRLNLVNDILDSNNEPCVIALQEMCAIDVTDRKSRMVSTTLLPKNIELVENKYALEFSKLDSVFEEEDLIETIQIRLNNLDFYKHTNNLEYVKMMINTFTLSEFESLNIDEFEIHYLVESKFGDYLTIYRKQVRNGYEFLVKCGDRVITRAKIQTK